MIEERVLALFVVAKVRLDHLKRILFYLCFPAFRHCLSALSGQCPTSAKIGLGPEKHFNYRLRFPIF
jgi:hypothetical protein